MKKLLVMLLAATLLLSCVACSGETKPTEKTPANTPQTSATDANQNAQNTDDSLPTITIGLLNRLGPDGLSTNDFYEIGMQIAADRLAAVSGANVVVTRLDYGADGSEMKQRMTELKEKGCACIIGVIPDDVASIAAQWAKENKFPVIYAANTSTEVTITNYSPYIFSTGLNTWGFIKVFADEAVNKRGFKNYAYVGSDGAAAVDAENILLLEAKKYNPDFECVTSFRVGQETSDFTTIVTSLMGLPEAPDMILHQGGGNAIAFTQQASMYDYFEQTTVWSDVMTAQFIAPALVEAGIFKYGKVFGATPIGWWTENFKEFNEEWAAKSEKIYGKAARPIEFGVYPVWAADILADALNTMLAEGKDYMDADALVAALEGASFEAVGSEHHFRDFDHQLTMDMYFIDSVDGGEELGHLPIPADQTAIHKGEEYLPTKEDMKWYAEEILGITDRF